jgi:hypothetical protein
MERLDDNIKLIAKDLGGCGRPRMCFERLKKRAETLKIICVRT